MTTIAESSTRENSTRENTVPGTTIPEICEAMQRVLTIRAEELARPTGFVERKSKLSASVFAKTLVFGWLQVPQASLSKLAQVAAALGVQISPQGIDERFTSEAAELLRKLLDAAAIELVATDPVAISILRRFTAVLVDDSSTLSLPDELATVWQGTGERTGHNQAALKLELRQDLLSGRLQGPFLESGRTQDRRSFLQKLKVPTKALRLSDLGYFGLEVLAAEDAAGSYWLSRLQVQTAVFDAEGQRWEVGQLLASQSADTVDMQVTLGVDRRLPARLLAARVPPEVTAERRRKLIAEASHKGQMVSKARLALADWTILVTNTPVELLSVEDALVIARVRWQIELLFKLWKSDGQIDTSRSHKAWRILCEMYAKLLAMTIQNWLLILGCWDHPDRSLTKAAAAVRANVAVLLVALAGYLPLATAVGWILNIIQTTSHMNTRKKEPNAYQLLQALDQGGLA